MLRRMMAWWLSVSLYIIPPGASEMLSPISALTKAVGYFPVLHDGDDVSERSVLFPIQKSMFHVRDMSPLLFQRIRKASGIQEAQFKRSVTQTLVLYESNSLGSISKKTEFYWTADRRYMIKSISKVEVDQLLCILPRYANYVSKNCDTFIAPICALFAVEYTADTSSIRETKYFLITESVFPPESRNSGPMYTFDLKGSSFGRQSLAPGDPINARVCLKDNDFRNAGLILKTKSKRELLIKQLQLDSEFLRNCNLMDYSLLLGIQPLQRPNVLRGVISFIRSIPAAFESHRRRRSFHCLMSKPGDGGIPAPVSVHCGVIDFLQPYTSTKWAETKWKTLSKNEATISCVSPELYSSRFTQFMEFGVFRD